MALTQQPTLSTQKRTDGYEGGLARTLVRTLLIFTLIPLAIMAGAAYLRARSLLRDQVVSQMQAQLKSSTWPHGSVHQDQGDQAGSDGARSELQLADRGGAAGGKAEHAVRQPPAEIQPRPANRECGHGPLHLQRILPGGDRRHDPDGKQTRVGRPLAAATRRSMATWRARTTTLLPFTTWLRCTQSN